MNPAEACYPEHVANILAKPMVNYGLKGLKRPVMSFILVNQTS